MKKPSYPYAFCLKKVSILLLFLLIGGTVAAQTSPDSNHTRKPKDSLIQLISKQIQTIGRSEVNKSVEKYKLGKNIIRQREVIGELKKMYEHIKLFLREGIDTTGLSKMIATTKASIEIVKDGITVNEGSNQTQRNLTVSASILTELAERIKHAKASIDNYSARLDVFQTMSDSLSSDSALFSFEPDSAGIAAYGKRILVIAKESSPIDTALKKAMLKVQDLQYNVDVIAFEIQSLQEDIETLSTKLAKKAFSKEFPYLWEPPAFSRPLAEIIHFSLVKESMTLVYYLSDNLLLLVVLLLLVFAAWYFVHALKSKLAHENKLTNDGSSGQLILRRPLLSGIFITINIFQFLFYKPPFIFSCILWLVTAICLAVIFAGFISKFWMRFWIIIICFFIISSLDNMLLQISRAERIFTALLALAGMLYAGFILIRSRKKEVREKNIIYFITILFISQLISFLLNVAGRYNLSKNFLVAGYSGIIIAILFLWVLRLVNEGLTLAFSSYQQPERRSFFINFKRVGNEVPGIFYVLLVIGWFFLVGRNFYGFAKFYAPVTTFFTTERTLGDYTFTVMGAVVFILILTCSVFLSKLVSFFASEPVGVDQVDGSRKKISPGNWILLIRILIITMGIFLSFAATGISLDRITIVLGALGVGIGLGLQELFNNLVSGVVLSFERPVHVGDVIELDGKMGTMKSIGFRSSIISTHDGASIIIPNGELLSHRLINWSMGHNLKQNSILFTVAYESDLEKVKGLLWQILNEDERILNYPPANVVFKELNRGAIDVEILFWPTHISQSLQMRSDIIARINTVFKKEGITVPIPQQELYIRSLPGEDKENNEGKHESK